MQQLEVAVHKQRWVLTVAAAASFMVGLDALVVATALPTIRHELGASLSSLEWTVNAYTLSFAVLLMSAAALGDRYGRRRMFSFGVALFGAGSVGCALAPSVGLLVSARAVQGAGAAFVLPLALALLTGAFAARAAARSRHLRRRRGQRRGARAPVRRRARAGHLLAVDLLAQPAAGGGADHDRSCPP
jgi:MFS family permease